MKIFLFGATGMIGGGALRWLITSPNVDHVVAVSRKELLVQHAGWRIYEGGAENGGRRPPLKEYSSLYFAGLNRLSAEVKYGNPGSK